MKTTLTDVQRMAKLARIALTTDEEIRIESDLAKMLKYIEMLNEVDISNVKPTAHASGLSNALRDDFSTEKHLQGAILANAPALVEDVLIRVPAVLPSEEM